MYMKANWYFTHTHIILFSTADRCACTYKVTDANWETTEQGCLVSECFYLQNYFLSASVMP